MFMKSKSISYFRRCITSGRQWHCLQTQNQKRAKRWPSFKVNILYSSKMIMKAAHSGGAFSWHQVITVIHDLHWPNASNVQDCNFYVYPQHQYKSFCQLTFWSGLRLLLWEWVANTSLWVSQPSYWPLLQVARCLSQIHILEESICGIKISQQINLTSTNLQRKWGSAGCAWVSSFGKTGLIIAIVISIVILNVIQNIIKIAINDIIT